VDGFYSGKKIGWGDWMPDIALKGLKGFDNQAEAEEKIRQKTRYTVLKHKNEGGKG